MKTDKINRRSLLKGIGGVAIGLPFLEEMVISSARAAAPAITPPVRAFNLFFGLGIPSPLQQEGFKGVMEPLKEVSDKLLIMRNVDHVRCDKSGMNAHFDGSSGAFTAEPPAGDAKSGGPSIDQVIRQAYYPKGLPKGMVSTLVGGTFFRRSRLCRYVHSYKMDGTVAGTMQEKPRDLFERVFGTVNLGDADAKNLREKRLKRSVLDSVVEQYQYFTGPNSPLGSKSKSRVTDHLDRIRELEQRAYALQYSKIGNIPVPGASKVPHEGHADPGGEGIDITLSELTTEWRLMAELYALSIIMDRVRFGSLTFLAAGERIRLTGDYKYNGKLVYQFDDAKERNKSGAAGCSHEWWHAFNPKKDNKQLRAHAHMKMRELAFFLKLLDTEDTNEANGKTILDNSLITISTESGDGRHNDVKRELSGIFHAITGANGLFKTGQILDVNHEGIDVYNTMLSAMNIKNKLGPAKRDHAAVDKIRT